MKKYTEVLKETKNYFYLYCNKCEEVYIDDLYYLRVQKFCSKCGSVPAIIRGDQPLSKEQVLKIVEENTKQQKLNNLRKSNLIIK